MSSTQIANRALAVPAGSGTGIDIEISLGTVRFKESAGQLQLKGAKPSAALSTPSGLSYDFDPSVQVELDVNGVLQKIHTSEANIEFVVINPYKYEIRFQTLSGTILKTIAIANPDGSGTTYNRLQITETDGATSKLSEFIWSVDDEQWALITGNGQRNETRKSVVDSLNSTHIDTIVVRDSNDTVVSKRIETFKIFVWGERQIEEVIDPDGAKLTTLWAYYDVQNTDGGNYTHLQQMISPTGYWERYEYDSTGRQTKTVAQYGDAAPTAGESECRVTTTTYGSGDPAVTVVEALLGHETARRYTVFRPGETRDIQAQTVGALWDAPDNLTTVSKVYLGTQFDGELQNVTNPDGTMSIYAYSVGNDNQKRTTIKTGQPNSDGTDIISGTRTETVVDIAGNKISENTFDIATGILLSFAATTQQDSFGRPTRIEYNDGTFEAFTYGCCGVETSKNREGLVTTFDYDELQRVKSSTRAGITTLTQYDAEGRVVKTTRKGADDTEIIVNQSEYDITGRLILSKNALNYETANSEILDANGHTVRTTIMPGLDGQPNGPTRIETFFKDGSLLSVTGTAVHPLKDEYGVEIPLGPGETLPRPFAKEIRVGDNGAETEWTKTYADMLGRSYKTVTSGGAITQSYFNNQGQLEKQVDPDGVTTLFQYNAKGEQEYVVVDMNRDGIVDFTGTDRIQRTQNDVANVPGKGDVRRTTTTVYTTDNAITTTTSSVNEITTDSLQSWNTTFGLTTRSRTIYDGDGGRIVDVTNPDGSYSRSDYKDGRPVAVTQFDSAVNQLSKTTSEYDAHGRLAKSTDARTGTTTYEYDDADQILSVTTPQPSDLESAQKTKFEYDTLGRRRKTTLPDGDEKVVRYEYYDTGELKKTFGARTYPVEYTYDSQGRLEKLKTWRDFQSDGGTAITTWQYNSVNGLLDKKIYADGKGPSYKYKLAGRLEKRTWARGLVTDYFYNNAGELEKIVYSDETPGVTYAYDRRGRRTKTSGTLETVDYEYNDAGQLLTESHSGGPLNGVIVKQKYDSLLRREKLSAILGTQELSHTGYSYDDASRLEKVSDDTHSAVYAYLPNSSRVDSIIFTKNGTPVLTTTKQYDNLNRLTNISNLDAQSSVLNSFAYKYNSANQRTYMRLADGSFWVYQYDSLGQVTSGKKYFPDGAPVTGQQFEYSFDTIGNRKEAKSGGNPGGTGLRVSAYSPNALNQYEEKTVPGSFDLLGTAKADATVTVNTQPTYRKGEYFWKELTADNLQFPAYPEVHVVGVKSNAGPNGEDVVTGVTGNIFLPKTPEAFTHDDDGNLTLDGRWIYSWDAENRLIAMETNPSASAVAPNQRLEFVYDYYGRRIQKTVYSWSPLTLNFQLSAQTKFVYGDWNCVAELDAGNILIRSYQWGNDLSGSRQGAGGVGGLLLINAGGNRACFTAYDANGNVTALVTVADGTLGATYEYGSFGEVIRSTGVMADANPFRFSTKYQDNQTGYLYYGYRYYSTSSGRWLSREPLEENESENLYSFVSNGSLNSLDVLGLSERRLDPALHRLALEPEASTIPNSGFLSLNYQDFFDEIKRQYSFKGVSISGQVIKLTLPTIPVPPPPLTWEQSAYVEVSVRSCKCSNGRRGGLLLKVSGKYSGSLGLGALASFDEKPEVPTPKPGNTKNTKGKKHDKTPAPIPSKSNLKLGGGGEGGASSAAADKCEFSIAFSGEVGIRAELAVLVSGAATGSVGKGMLRYPIDPSHPNGISWSLDDSQVEYSISKRIGARIGLFLNVDLTGSVPIDAK